MRISGGALKGRKLGSQKIFTAAHGDACLRPTSSKVREALFDILKLRISDSFFLDLYAGTGTVGFEALSRGASVSYFVESDPVRAKAIQHFIKNHSLDKKALVYKTTARDFLVKAEKTGMKFDIIFADPPYASDEIERVIPLLVEKRLIREGGSLMIEHPSRSPLKEDHIPLRLINNYRYGDTMLTLYRNEP